MDEETEARLRQLWTAPGEQGAYGGVEKLYRSALAVNLPVTREQVRTFLSGVTAYSLTFPRRRRFKRSKVFSAGINDVHGADYMDVSHLSEDNDSIKWILVIKDAFTRKLWAVPTTSKTSKATIEAFDRVYSNPANVPRYLQTDYGGELVCGRTQAYLKSKHIRPYQVPNREIKTSFAERVIRVLQSLIFRYLLHNLTRRYIDQLQAIVDGYNKTVNRATGHAPLDIDKTNEQQVFHRLYPELWQSETKKVEKTRKRTLEPGTSVRLMKERQLLDKEAQILWTPEIFKIDQVIKRPRDGSTAYKVSNLNGEEKLFGTFYPSEVQKVPTNEAPEYLIEQILKSRKKRRGGREYFVKFIGLKEPKWVPETDLIKPSSRRGVRSDSEASQEL